MSDDFSLQAIDVDSSLFKHLDADIAVQYSTICLDLQGFNLSRSKGFNDLFAAALPPVL
jgi:hypothetical protein